VAFFEKIVRAKSRGIGSAKRVSFIAPALNAARKDVSPYNANFLRETHHEVSDFSENSLDFEVLQKRLRLAAQDFGDEMVVSTGIFHAAENPRRLFEAPACFLELALPGLGH
jgi:hypothetical protein